MWAWISTSNESTTTMIHKVQVPIPQLSSPEHILIKVHAAGINPVDVHKLKAIQPPKTIIRK
jgi:NADPH:quinone reductase-like Zn-dependent oxidoreductase